MSHFDDDQLREVLPALRRFAGWLCRDDSAADDLLQSCLEKALAHQHSRRQPEAPLKPWLFSIMHRLFLDGRRRASRWQRLLGRLADTESSAPSAERAAVANDALAAFARLSPDQRAVLLLVAVEGMSYQDTALALGLPIGTVMSRLSRARAAYRQLTEGEPRAVATPTLRSVK